MGSNYKVGLDRDQLFWGSLDNLVSPDSAARVVDAFVDTCDMSKFKFSSTSNVGNRPYDPRTLLKVYLLGYIRTIRSSRKLERALLTDIEFIWISNNLKIKHTTIADFRKDNHKLLKKIMFEYNLNLKNFDIISTNDSTDGVKVKAVNSKENNFTLSKIDDRISRIKNHIDEYEIQFDEEENTDALKEELKATIDEYHSKLQYLQNLQNHMINNNLSQISLTDPESKLMRNNGKFEVSFNNQVCVDMKSHIIKTFQLTNDPADLGHINSVSNEVKDVYGFDIVTNTTDKGYNDRNDMINCLEDGIIPEVTPSNDNTSFNLETIYEENTITDTDINSLKKEDIKKCLRAGVIPNVYKDVIENIEVKQVAERNYTKSEIDDELSLDQKRDLAIKDNCFVRDIKTNSVFCPMGEILRQKSRNGHRIRYCNKLACKRCKKPCSNSSFKSIDFAPNQIIAGSKNKQKKTQNKIKRTFNKVFIKLKPNGDFLKKRMATSEHPHASMKFWDNARFLLLKGISKANGELALYYCAYNIRRSINLLGTGKLIEYFKTKKANI